MMQVFGLDEKEDVKEEFACWLLKDVSEYHAIPSTRSWPVLKGYMYLTSGHICFFALMPEKEVSPPPAAADSRSP
jgi:sterol 3beta-glucosyltransferase